MDLIGFIFSAHGACLQHYQDFNTNARLSGLYERRHSQAQERLLKN